MGRPDMTRTAAVSSTTKPARPLAGRRYVPLYVLLRHRGRRSGRAYATPVVGMRVPGGFAIPMAFGESADWYRNIVAAGGATIRKHGTDHHLGDPAAIDPDS